ncbi:MAG: NAD-dependent epimerase/dehydratase family protein [Filifactor alocis]|nr:NAD-dependent epimerase/dehydratase family protein [Filifactor alocis]
MKRVLVTGGTVFVSKYTAQYYLNKGYEVFVLNRNTRSQLPGTRLIQADRQHLSNALKGLHFDVVFDINSYDKDDSRLLLAALEDYGDYIFISSSAVYPDTAPQPFSEGSSVGPNSFWKSYGTNKIEAEQVLTSRDPKAYILRPPTSTAL